MARPRRSLAVAAVLAAGLITACSSSSGGTSATSGIGTSASSGSSSSGTSAAGNGSCASAAAQDLKNATADPTVNYTALSKPATTLTAGKGAVWYVGDEEVQATKDIGTSLVAADAAVGLKTKVFDSSGSTASVVQGMQAAVSQGASAIVLTAIQTTTVVPGLQAAQKAHIPVISIFEAAEGPAASAVKGVVVEDAKAYANIYAAWALTSTKCDAHIGFVYAPIFSLEVTVLSLLKQDVASACSSCSVIGAPENFLQETTSVPPLAASLIEQNQNLNSIVLPNAADVPLVLPALKTVGGGRTIKIATFSGTQPADSLFAQPTSAVAAEDYDAPYDFYGWEALDTLLRSFEAPGGYGDVGTVYLPQILVTKADASSNPIASLTNFQQKYEAAWKG